MRPGFAGLLLAVLVLGWVRAGVAETLSGYTFLTPEMQALQDDEFGNPGQLTIDAGRALFATTAAGGKSCSSCHGDEGSALRFVRQYGGGQTHPLIRFRSSHRELMGDRVPGRLGQFGLPHELSDKKAVAFFRRDASGRRMRLP